MNNHPAVMGSTGFQQLKSDARSMLNTMDKTRRDIWLREKVSASVVVGSGDVTLADVQRWLREALSSKGQESGFSIRESGFESL